MRMRSEKKGGRVGKEKKEEDEVEEGKDEG